MERFELNTLKNFIKSNNAFLKNLEDNKIEQVDIYVQLELIILYFKLNSNYLTNLTSEESLLINDIIFHNNFIICNQQIEYNNQVISIDYLISLITKIEMLKTHALPKKENNIINLIPSNRVSEYTNTNNSNIINFKLDDIYPKFTMLERFYLFENTLILDKYTMPFVNENNHKFAELINQFILNILSTKSNNHIKNHILELKIIYAYMSMYPYISYATNKIDINLETLNIPQNEIGLVKSTYQDDYVRIIKNELESIQKDLIKYIKQRKILESYNIEPIEAISKLKKKIAFLERTYQEKELKYDNYIHHQSVYNKNLLSFIMKAFEQGNVNISEDELNPILKIFYIENREVKFYCAIHLENLVHLIDTQILNSQLTSHKTLNKINENKPMHL